MEIKYTIETTHKPCETCGRIQYPHPRCDHERISETSFVAETIIDGQAYLYAKESKDIEDFEKFKVIAAQKIKETLDNKDSNVV